MSEDEDGCGCLSGLWGIGTILAVIISWTTWKSIIWSCVHGILGWFYVIYYLIKY